MTTRRQEKRQSNLLIRLLLVVVFSGGYLALAVLGRGGIGALFAQPALIALTVVLVALCGTALVAGVGERRSAREGSTASEGMKAATGRVGADHLGVRPHAGRRR
jgi:hypothetical protein